MKYLTRHTLTALLALLLATTGPVSQSQAAVETHSDESTGLLSWKAQHPGFSLQFIQLLPDYVRAVYGARGLPQKVVDLMASYCIFGTIIKNESGESLGYRVADWRYMTADGQPHPIKTKTQWLKEWQDMGVAFRWSLLPDEQQFAPGDWSQGFTTLPLAPGTSVKIKYQWTQQGETHDGIFKDLRCAPDSTPDD